MFPLSPGQMIGWVRTMCNRVLLDTIPSGNPSRRLGHSTRGLLRRGRRAGAKQPGEKKFRDSSFASCVPRQDL